MSTKATEISCYSNYCQQMRTLRADRNRVLISCDAVAVSAAAAKKIKELVVRAYNSICCHGTALAKQFIKAFENNNVGMANKAAKKLNQFTRRITKYCQALEEEMVPHEDFPDGYEPKEIDPTIKFDCKRFLDVLEPATHDIVNFIAQSK